MHVSLLIQTRSFSLNKVLLIEGGLMLIGRLELCGLLILLQSTFWTLILTAPIHYRGYVDEQVM